MSDSNDNRKWLVLIALGALLVLLWEDGPNLFHFHWNLPFWPVVTVVFAIWWMSGGKHRLRDDSDEVADVDADAGTESADENDEETDNKA